MSRVSYWCVRFARGWVHLYLFDSTALASLTLFPLPLKKQYRRGRDVHHTEAG
jgi:hypothetical protein